MGTWEVETQSEVGSRSALSLSNTGTGQITRPPWLRRISSSLGARPWWEDSAQHGRHRTMPRVPGKAVHY